jgi:hypothetical protein
VAPRKAAVEAEDLVGVWRLRSWRNVAGDGSASDPLGEKPVGYILYDPDGFVSVQIMAAHREPYDDPDPFGGTPAERSQAMSTHISYFGRFEVPPDQGTVIHHIEVCSYPNWIGVAQLRLAKLDGDVLTLTTRPMTIQGVERTAELVWERVGRG